MTSTYTSPLGVEKPGLGDYFNTWHTPANLGYDLLADAIAGVTALALTGDTTLAITDGADSTGRAHVLNITSSDQHDRVITVPAVSKTYVVRNASSYRVSIKPTAGTATEILPGTSAHILVTSTHCYRIATTGWGLFSSTATTSGASVTITLTTLAQHFSDIKLVFSGVGTGGDLRYALRTDAASSSGTITGYSGAATLHGGIEIENYRAGSGSLTSRLAPAGSSPYVIAATATDTMWQVTGGIGSIVLSNSAGSFSAGSVDCYLR